MSRIQSSINNMRSWATATANRFVFALADGISLRSLLSSLSLLMVFTVYSPLATSSGGETKYSEPRFFPAADSHRLSEYYWAQSGAGSLGQAIRMAKRQYPGRVLSAKTQINRRGDAVYRIKILSKSGEIRTIGIPSSASSKSKRRA